MMVEKNTGHIYTVSKLTREIKSLLEETYPFVWVVGEISNYAVPGSGHAYFTLKDQFAVINGVMFKNQRRRLKFEPENGLNVFGLARLALYEPRGSYQLIFEHLEPEGAGSMQIAFEQLKKKLSEKGFFDEKFKQAIPFLPGKISVITSGSGAAVQDIITVARRRFSNCCLEIVPVRVQGQGSADEICDAIQLVNQYQRSDVIILARGGGSMEDLAAFNSESVAEAVFHSVIPVITGIGHETDVTIADFVADLRAPTPSAAAELALPDKFALVQRVSQFQELLTSSILKRIQALYQAVESLASRLKSPETRVYDFRFTLEDYESRLSHMMKHTVQYNREKLLWLSASLGSRLPQKKISDFRLQVKTSILSLTRRFQTNFQTNQRHVMELTARLEALNPNAVLKRGYSIARFASGKQVITRSIQVKNKDQIEVILFKGQLIARVEKINGQEENI